MNRDVLFSIALEMDLPNIISMCRTSSKINDYICNSRNFWIRKIKKEYPTVPIEKIQDPRTLYKKLYKTVAESARWDYWYALKRNDNDLINSLPYIYEVTYPNVIVTQGDEWRFYDTLLQPKEILFSEGFYPQQTTLYQKFMLIINNGVPIEKYYDFSILKYKEMLEKIRGEKSTNTELAEEYVPKLLAYFLKIHKSSQKLHKNLTDILYRFLQEKGQVYPSGTPYTELYKRK